MADVFISYSKARAAEAAELAQELADLGYEVWWDTSLLPTGSFGAAIDRELDAATAVIVMWSPEAVRSKWVRSEASHADRQDKLVNCHVPEITNPAAQIPKPFDQTHSVLADDIRAIVGALDALSVPRSGKAGANVPAAALETTAQTDDRLFKEVEADGSAEGYQFYLHEFPQGAHAAIARFRLRGLTAPPPMVSPTPVPLASPVTEAPPSPPARPGQATRGATAATPASPLGGEAGATATGEGVPHTQTPASGAPPHPVPLPRGERGTTAAPVQRYKVRVGSGADDRIVERAPGATAPKDAPFAPEMVLVPPGTYLQGDETKPIDGIKRREVTIGYPLLVGKYPVTFEEWDAYVEKASSGGFLGVGGSKPHKPDDKRWGRGRRPVINVSWRDAQAYATWLSQTTGKTYRLLSEAEWEYACRSGTETAYSFGDESKIGDYAWYSANSGSKTQPVGDKKPNGFGLHDMHGNVWEWCEDAWADSYQGAPVDGAARASADTSVSRVLRGGSWNNNPLSLRSADRLRDQPFFRNGYLGFRLARTLNPTP